jgi:hypothetical protein
MSGEILTLVFRQMDKLGITIRGLTKHGMPITPLVILDGHPSRMDSKFLTYTNKVSSKWTAVLRAWYGTSKLQLHDDAAKNGTFKSALANTKKDVFEEEDKWLTSYHQAPGDCSCCEGCS